MTKPRGRFLIVDDSPAIRHALRNALEQARRQGPLAGAADVTEADSVEAALAQFRPDHYEAVFLDIELQDDEQAGVALLEQVHEQDHKTNVIIVTGLGQDDEDVVEAMQQGAFAYIQKPIRLEDVERVLHEIEIQAGNFRRI